MPLADSDAGKSRAHLHLRKRNSLGAKEGAGTPRASPRGLGGAGSSSRRQRRSVSSQDGDDVHGSVEVKDCLNATEMCEKAMIAFLKIMVEINRVKEITEYETHPLLSEKVPGFKVRMGFGLHAGWAIEGAIGSIYKVDATYLSPHVNMAARMERATAQYGVPLLMTEAIHAQLSENAKLFVRKLDVVTVKGSAQPIGLFTYDVWDTTKSRRLPMASFADVWDKQDTWQKDFKVIPEDSRRISITGGAQIIEHKVKKVGWSENIFLVHGGDSDLVALRAHITEKFRVEFKKGVDSYIGGQWGKARAHLEKCVKLNPHVGGDGPSRTLLGFMGGHGFQAPVDWPGYRALTSK